MIPPRAWIQALAIWACLVYPSAPVAAGGPAERGEYLLRAAGCVSCHTGAENDAPFLAGGRAIETPFGTFYGPNITPDEETGIGAWSEADLARALGEGRDPDGRHYFPAFPYTSYTRMKADDVRALWAYLRTVEPVRQENRPHELSWPVRNRGLMRWWKSRHFRAGEFQPQTGESEEWNRGAYLVKALAHCAECHSPRTAVGGLDVHRKFHGARLATGDIAPNITPDRETGIGRWPGRHIVRYLEFGMDPSGDFAGAQMADVIADGTSHLTDADRRAIAVYLLSLTPARHNPE